MIKFQSYHSCEEICIQNVWTTLSAVVNVPGFSSLAEETVGESPTERKKKES